LDLDKLEQLTHALDSRRVAGFLVESDPDRSVDSWPTEDNSAVFHARRLAGKAQGVFASASALGVNCHLGTSFFPDIYNEDWFFLLDELRRPAAPQAETGRRRTYRTFTEIGKVRQRAYDPFAPDRARYEEFGDLIAEGLLAHMHLGRRGDPDPDYWHAFMQNRASLLRRIGADLDRTRGRFADAARETVAAAVRQNEVIKPTDCVDFLQTLEADKLRWNGTLTALRERNHLYEALSDLDLRPAKTA
jgi:hypothetical protein